MSPPKPNAPRTSSLTFNTFALVQNIFEGIQKDQLNQEAIISRENAECMSNASRGFMYRGHLFTHLKGLERSKGPFGTIATDVVPLAEAHLAERDAIRKEKPRAQQALALVLKGTETFQDIRDALPDFLAPCSPHLINLQRTREEAYTLSGNPKQKEQYMRLRDILEYHMVAKMVR